MTTKKQEFMKQVDKVQDIERDYLYSQDSQALGQLGKYLLTHDEIEVLFTLMLNQGFHSHLRPTVPIEFKPEGMDDDAFYNALDSLIQVGVVRMEEGMFFWLHDHQIYQYLMRILSYEDDNERYDEGKKIRSEHDVEGIPSGMMLSMIEDIHRNTQTEEGWMKNLEYLVTYL